MLLKEWQVAGFGIGRYLYMLRKNWYPIRQQGRGYVFTETPVLELNNEIESKYNNERRYRSK